MSIVTEQPAACQLETAYGVRRTATTLDRIAADVQRQLDVRVDSPGIIRPSTREAVDNILDYYHESGAEMLALDRAVETERGIALAALPDGSEVAVVRQLDWPAKGGPRRDEWRAVVGRSGVPVYSVAVRELDRLAAAVVRKHDLLCRQQERYAADLEALAESDR